MASRIENHLLAQPPLIIQDLDQATTEQTCFNKCQDAEDQMAPGYEIASDQSSDPASLKPEVTRRSDVLCEEDPKFPVSQETPCRLAVTLTAPILGQTPSEQTTLDDSDLKDQALDPTCDTQLDPSLEPERSQTDRPEIVDIKVEDHSKKKLANINTGIHDSNISNAASSCSLVHPCDLLKPKDKVTEETLLASSSCREEELASSLKDEKSESGCDAKNEVINDDENALVQAAIEVEQCVTHTGTLFRELYF